MTDLGALESLLRDAHKGKNGVISVSAKLATGADTLSEYKEDHAGMVTHATCRAIAKQNDLLRIRAIELRVAYDHISPLLDSLPALIAELRAAREDAETKDAIAEWFANGQTGQSSKTMALWLGFGKVHDKQGWGPSHPHDPSDLKRCLKLLAMVPQLREKLPTMRELSPEWAGLIDQWQEVESTFRAEVANGTQAPKTYDLMRVILDAARSAT